jgi:hypothetical protein
VNSDGPQFHQCYPRCIFFLECVCCVWQYNVGLGLWCLCDNVCQWLVTGQWFSLSTLVSSTNKTDRHNITAVLLKMVLNTINLTLHYIVRHNTHILRKIYIEDNIDGIVGNQSTQRKPLTCHKSLTNIIT